MKNSRIKIYLACVWLVLTSSLIIWWMYFALGLVAKFDSESTRHHYMLVLEGLTLLTLLIVGGGTLIWLITQENRRTEILRSFFAAFSHDMKTAVASLRLQTESLQQDLPQNSGSAHLLKRLISDTSRILVATDNSLFLAQSDSNQLFIEDVALEEILQSMKDSWPQISITINGKCRVSADRRALHTIFENLILNSLAHGRATEMNIILKAEGPRCRIKIHDNGQGFTGDSNNLGTAFVRHTVTSGSGLGLSIIKKLVGQLGGDGPLFELTHSGFTLHFSIPRSDS